MPRNFSFTTSLPINSSPESISIELDTFLIHQFHSVLNVFQLPVSYPHPSLLPRFMTLGLCCDPFSLARAICMTVVWALPSGTWWSHMGYTAKTKVLPLPESIANSSTVEAGSCPLPAPCLTTDGSHLCRPNADIPGCYELRSAQRLHLVHDAMSLSLFSGS